MGGRETSRASRCRPGPRTATLSVPLDDDEVLVLSGAGAAGRGPRAAPRVHRPARARAREQRSCRAEAAARVGAGRGQRAAHRPARRGVPRPAHAAVVDQGVGRPASSRTTSTGRRAATEEFLETIDEETDRLDALVGNLLDMSRLQSRRARSSCCATSGSTRSSPAALAGLGDRAARGSTCASPRPCPASTPTPRCSSGRSPTSSTTRSRGRPTAGRSSSRRARSATASTCASSTAAPASRPSSGRTVFEPFQRLGDRSNGSGVGLGLAVAKGFVEAMGGSVTVDDTPGGGLTMVDQPAGRVDA